VQGLRTVIKRDHRDLNLLAVLPSVA